MPNARPLRVLALVLGALVVLTTVAPAAAAQGAEPDAGTVTDEKARETSLVTFYGHVFGHGLDAPMPANTQFPKGEDNYGLGTFDYCTPAATATGLPPTNVQPGKDCDSDPNNKLVFYSTAGFVQVSSGSEFSGGGGYAQLHNERGSTKDIVLDTSKPISASVFLSQDFHAWSVSTGTDTYCLHPHPQDAPCVYPYWGWDPGMSPTFVVKASLYYAVLGEYGSAASDMPPIREALEGGQATLVAEGATEPAQVINGIPGYENVYEFTVDLGSPQVGLIPKEANFFLVFSVYNQNGDTKWSGHTWRWWSGEFFPPRFTLPVKNAFDVEGVIPQFVHNKLAIMGVINTPWGSYDVDPAATKLTITNAKGQEIEPVRMEQLADYSVAHGAHYKPVNVTFVWDYVADGLPPGTYSASISAANHQRTAAAECTGTFTILEGGRAGGVTPGICGLQTDAEHKEKEGDPNAPAAAGGSARLPEPPLPTLPVLGLAGLVLARRRGWS